MATCAAGFIVSHSLPPQSKLLSFDLYRFGQIPVVSEGRTKPLDSAARAALLTITGRTEITVGEKESKQKISAIQWLLEVITDAKDADDRPIFRVENLEVQEMIGVKKREGMRYSRNEIRGRDEEFEKQVRSARQIAKSDRKQLSVYQKKVLELSEKVSTYENLKFAFGLQNRIGGDNQEQVLKSFQMATQFAEALEEQGQPIFAVGPQPRTKKNGICCREHGFSI